jgi:hypothetical protein
LRDTFEKLTELAENASLDPGKQREDIWFGFANREKISQIINTDHCLLFSPLFVYGYM